MVNLDDTRALERIGAALEDISRGLKKPEPAGAEPAGVPILLIVEVVIALIRILSRNLLDQVDCAKLRDLRRKLEPYRSVRATKEVE